MAICDTEAQLPLIVFRSDRCPLITPCPLTTPPCLLINTPRCSREAPLPLIVFRSDRSADYPWPQISARGVPPAPWHPGQAIISTGYLPNINSYGPAHNSRQARRQRQTRRQRSDDDVRYIMHVLILVHTCSRYMPLSDTCPDTYMPLSDTYMPR